MTKQNYPSKTQLWSACLGNFFEHYDTALFGFLSVFLAPLIFPNEDPITALILTYAMIPLGMLARPLGALVFGRIGDIYGRRYALFLTLGGMSIVSGCIAFSPTYQQAGILAPIIFGLGRILQNFLASGETMGGAIFLLENTSEKRHDILSSLYNTTTIGGLLFASAGVTVFTYYNAIEWGWRALYLIGCLTAFFGFMIRRRSSSYEPGIDNSAKKPLESLSNLINIFWTYRISLLLIAISSGFAYANYSIALILTNGFIPLVSSVTKAEMMSLNTALLIFDLCTLPVFGWIASKISREKVMLGASLAVALSGIPLFMLIPYASFAGIIAIRICFVLFGVAFFAPFHAWAQQLVPSNCRYAIVSLGYAMGSQLFGGPTAALSLWAFQTTERVSSVAWYWVVLAISSSLAIAVTMKQKTKIELSEIA